MNVKISVAMATYNGEKFLKEQLDSIYSQSYLPYEVIVTDDCSTDSTVSILEQYKESHGLKYYVNEQNVGYNKNFEKALSLCQCDYIAISDQDDVWMKNKLEVSLVKLLEIENDLPAMVSTSNNKVNDKLEIINISNPKNKQYLNYYDSIFNCLSHGATIIINRKLLNLILPFPDSKNYVYDAYIGFVASFCGNKYYIPQKLINHRIHDNNSFHKKNSHKKNKIASRFIDYYMYIKRNKYCGLMPEGSYQLLKIMDSHCNSAILNERKKLLYDLITIYESNYFKSIILILKLREIPFLKKIKIVFLSTLNSIINLKK
ncbi:MAG: glycosyltransferase family 2 protein [Bacteroidales bacterium]